MTQCEHCGEPMPLVTDQWGFERPKGGKYCSRSCQQAAYRQRLAAGTVVPRAVRRRQALEKRCDEVVDKLYWAELALKRARQEVKDLRELHKSLEAQLARGAESLPFTGRQRLEAATADELRDMHAEHGSWDAVASHLSVSLTGLRKACRREGVPFRRGA